MGEADRDLVLEHLIENNKASFKVGVSDLAESCTALGIGFHESRFVPAEDWYCDACGNQFKYTMCPSDDDKIDHSLFDSCPRCGFQVGWTKTRDAYAKYGGLTEKHFLSYQECVKGCLDRHIGKDRDGNPKPIYFVRSTAERERRDALKKPIQPEWMRTPRATTEAQALIPG